MTLAHAVPATDRSPDPQSRVAGLAPALARSELGRAGGGLITSVIDGERLRRLRSEALAVHSGARESRAVTTNDLVKGDPDRWLESAPGGPELDGLVQDRVLLDLLRQVTGVPWRPAGPHGSYSFYRREGHHLGIHRDIDACELACITCIVDEGTAGQGTSGVLRLFPDRVGESLQQIRDEPDRDAVDVRLRPGQTIILLGGFVPHRLMPMGPNHLRIVAPLCYQAGS